MFHVQQLKCMKMNDQSYVYRIAWYKPDGEFLNYSHVFQTASGMKSALKTSWYSKWRLRDGYKYVFEIGQVDWSEADA